MAAAGPVLSACANEPASAAVRPPELAGGQTPLANVKPGVVTTDEKVNSFGRSPATTTSMSSARAKRMRSATPAAQDQPLEGEDRRPVRQARRVPLEDLIKPFQLEERVYRLRCVEAWSMVIPWVGIPLSSILKRAEPQPKATFVEFTTLLRPQEMPGQTTHSLEWPYVEGLRMDEAMHALTIMAVGLYGNTLMNQNGAPIRLVVPWKYGFKSIKSVVRIRLVDKQPRTAWNVANPQEYGFYSNVNPQVDHPRWTQARERRIGEYSRRPTLMFNGYGDQVASMYAEMDLKKSY